MVVGLGGHLQFASAVPTPVRKRSHSVSGVCAMQGVLASFTRQTRSPVSRRGYLPESSWEWSEGSSLASTTWVVRAQAAHAGSYLEENVRQDVRQIGGWGIVRC